MTIITHPFPRFSEEEYTRRSSVVRALMQEANLSALLVFSTISSPYEVAYLANFPSTWETILVFPLEGLPTLLLELYNHVPNARQMASLADVRWGGPDLAESAARNVRERGLAQSTLGLVGKIPFQYYEQLRGELPQAVLVDFTGAYRQLRLVKSEEEIAFQRLGTQLSDRAIEALERPGERGCADHRDQCAVLSGLSRTDPAPFCHWLITHARIPTAV